MTEKVLIGLFGVAIALAGCAKNAEGVPLYPLDRCERVALIDSATGEAVVGAEDLAFDPRERRVIISAYDRRAVERQARRRAGALREGGLYAVSLDALASGEESLSVSSMVARDTVAGGLRPHGVAFDAERHEITFVNRAYEAARGRWRMAPRIERVGADGATFIGDEKAPRCSANDVATIGERTFVSFDHAACGWRGGLESALALRLSGVDAAEGGALYKGAGHANGVAATKDAGLALAATREHAILFLQSEDDAFRLKSRILLPGGPDNLSVSRDGAIIAAVYPSLLSIGAQRKLGVGRSGSRVVRVDPASGDVRLMFDDPRASLFSAASAAIEEEGVLVIGSALDRGVVVCKRENEAP